MHKSDQTNLIKTLFILCILFFAISPSTAVAFQNTITHLRVMVQKTGTRFILESSTPLKYHTFNLNNPPRLVIDTQQTKLSKWFKQPAFSNAFVKKFRTGKQKNGSLRIVFDLKKKTPTKIYTLQPAGNLGNRLVIDFGRTIAIHLPYIPKPVRYKLTAKPIKPPRSPSRPVVKAPRYSSKRDIIVVIDPGHGGKDSGAVGHRRHKEKTVVLSIAKRLARLLNRERGFRAKLTRHGDYYIRLRQRLAIARKSKADIFISIHADAFKNSHSRGASVFALSQRGATSEAARWLAHRENVSEELGGEKLAGKDYLLSSVLINLSQNHTIAESLKLGERLLKKLKDFAKLHYSHVEQAAFVVLKSPDIPSLLVETGFISNPKEERLLASPRYQERIAHALMLGIKQYFMKNPPPNTLFAPKKS